MGQQSYSVKRETGNGNASLEKILKIMSCNIFAVIVIGSSTFAEYLSADRCSLL